jgi:hypothetical protein
MPAPVCEVERRRRHVVGVLVEHVPNDLFDENPPIETVILWFQVDIDTGSVRYHLHEISETLMHIPRVRSPGLSLQYMGFKQGVHNAISVCHYP